MGYDVTFHPISETEIHEWYFKALADPEHAKHLARTNGVEEFDSQHYFDSLDLGKDVEADSLFDSTHGFLVAIIQGFFRKYHYIRGGALSFYGDAILPYTKPWSEIIPAEFQEMGVHNQLTQNYMSGVYIPADKVALLIQDLTSPSALTEHAEEVHPGPHLDILLVALREAEALNAGLLEATEVVEPNPFELNETTSRSDLMNCDTAGALLYREVAMEQVSGLTTESGEPIDMSKVERVVYHHDENDGDKADKPKKGFFSRLFGK